MTRNRRGKSGNSRGGNRNNSVNSITYSGRIGFTSNAAASTTFWMSPNSNYSSTWLGFTTCVAGIFGPNVNNLAHIYKEFRIRKLKVEIPPISGVNQIAAYTQEVGYITTTLSFPNVMEYPVAVYSGMNETHRLFMTVPKRVLRSTVTPWFTTEENPGTASTNPASDPNLSSHGLLIITDGGTSGYPYILTFSIEFRNPEASAQIEPSPRIPVFPKMTLEDIAFIQRMRKMTLDGGDKKDVAATSSSQVQRRSNEW
jgi:hypothetical protein